MATKKKPLVQEERYPDPPTHPTIQIMRNIPLQQLVQILLNGSRHPQFRTVHEGLMLVIRNAYTRRDPDAFLAAVQQYLEQAVNHVAQAGKPEDIPLRMMGLKSLITSVEEASLILEANDPYRKTGLEQVALRLLSVVHATL